MSEPSLSKSCSTLDVLYQGALLSVESWHCAGMDTPGQSEEWSNDDRLVITRSGAWELQVQGQATLALPGTAVYWRGHEHFRVRHPRAYQTSQTPACGDECTVIRLSQHTRNAIREAFPKLGSAAPFASPMSGSAYLRHRHMFLQAQLASCSDQACALAIEEPAMDLLAQARNSFAQGPNPHARKRSIVIDDTQAWIASHYLQPIHIERIARAVGCSMFHLSRLFQLATGHTLHQTVLRLRLRAALERVLDTPDALTRIALDCGFASPSHFATAFRKEYGCTPGSARSVFGRLRKKSGQAGCIGHSPTHPSA